MIIFDNPLYLISSQVTKSQLEWDQLTFYKVRNKKRECEKRKTSIKEGRVFQTALKGGENTDFAWENFDYSMPLSC